MTRNKNKTKQIQEGMFLNIMKAEGGYIIRECYEDDDIKDKTYVCTNIEQVYALIDKKLL